MKTVTTLILAVFFMGALDAQYFVQKDQPQPCGIDGRFEKRNQKQTEQIDLTNTSWRGTLLIEASSFSISVVKPSKNIQDRWGTFIHFEEGTFYTSYSAQCGNDCFQSTIGTFKLLDNNQIEFFVEKITRSGYCSQGTETIQKTLGIYQMTQSDNGISFVKIS